VPIALGISEAAMSACTLACWLFAAVPNLQVEAAWKIFWTIVVLIVIVIVTGGVIMFITRWFKRANSPEKAYGDDRTSFKVLYERGELTEEEYQKIRARLGQKLKDQLKVGAPNAADVPSPEPSNRLSPAPPEPTIRPAEEANPDDSDPSEKPA
jgi:uncharacterized membrane protein